MTAADGIANFAFQQALSSQQARIASLDPPPPGTARIGDGPLLEWDDPSSPRRKLIPARTTPLPINSKCVVLEPKDASARLLGRVLTAGTYLSPFGTLDKQTAVGRAFSLKPTREAAKALLPGAACDYLISKIAGSPEEVLEEHLNKRLTAWLDEASVVPARSSPSLDVSKWALWARFEEARSLGLSCTNVAPHLTCAGWTAAEISSLAVIVGERGYSSPERGRALVAAENAKLAAQERAEAEAERAEAERKRPIRKTVLVAVRSKDVEIDAMSWVGRDIFHLGFHEIPELVVIDLHSVPLPAGGERIDLALGVYCEVRELELTRADWFRLTRHAPFELLEEITRRRVPSLNTRDITFEKRPANSIEGAHRLALAKEAYVELEKLHPFVRGPYLADLVAATGCDEGAFIDFLRAKQLPNFSPDREVEGAMRGGAARRWALGELYRPPSQAESEALAIQFEPSGLRKIVQDLAKKFDKLTTLDVSAALRAAGVLETDAALSPDLATIVAEELESAGFEKAQGVVNGQRVRHWRRASAQ